MLLGAAKYLAETRQFDGTVVVIFQPADEGGGGGGGTDAAAAAAAATMLATEPLTRGGALVRLTTHYSLLATHYSLMATHYSLLILMDYVQLRV